MIIVECTMKMSYGIIKLMHKHINNNFVSKSLSPRILDGNKKKI